MKLSERMRAIRELAIRTQAPTTPTDMGDICDRQDDLLKIVDLAANIPEDLCELDAASDLDRRLNIVEKWHEMATDTATQAIKSVMEFRERIDAMDATWSTLLSNAGALGKLESKVNQIEALRAQSVEEIGQHSKQLRTLEAAVFPHAAMHLPKGGGR